MSARKRPTSNEPCRCGHAHLAHEHYRKGTDCALCVCERFRFESSLGRRTRRLRRNRSAATVAA